MQVNDMCRSVVVILVLSIFMDGVSEAQEVRDTLSTPYVLGKYPVNQFDSEGLKLGPWIKEMSWNNNEVIEEAYYKHGIKHGVYMLHERGKLLYIGEYNNGEKTGVWYCFDMGILMGKIYDFHPNTDHWVYYYHDNGRKFKHYPKYQAYFIAYYPNGCKKQEGPCLFDESFEIDCFYLGRHVFYTEDEDVKEIRIYGNNQQIIYSSREKQER